MLESLDNSSPILRIYFRLVIRAWVDDPCFKIALNNMIRLGLNEKSYGC